VRTDRRTNTGTLPPVRRTIAAIGRALVTIGLLILLFVAYQLWGTGVFAARAQARLDRDFEQARRAYQSQQVATTTTTTAPGGTTVPPRATTTTAPLTRPAPPIPPAGEVGGRIRIPEIGVDWSFVEGVSRSDLMKGPGHYPETPFPGTLGNAAIAGHRTTYGQPFHNLDELEPGDEIVIETLAGTFTYEMTEQLIVRPTQIEVVANTPDAQLTLTSCHPKGSASQRIVVKAKLVPNKSARPARPRPPRGQANRLVESGLEEGLEGETHGAAPAVAWGGFAAFVGLLWWWAFRRWRHPVSWVAGVIPFLAALAPFYYYLERTLPAGY
jgi:sortase A